MPTLPVTPTLDAIIEDFRGPWLRPNSTDVPASEALLSLNAEYGPHFVGTRFGFGQFWAAGKLFPTLYNWIKAPDSISASGNYLVVYNQTDGVVQVVPNLLTLVPFSPPLFSVTAEGISVATGGNQLLIASFKSAGGQSGPIPIGASIAHVTGIFPFEIDTEGAFMQPLSVKPILANSGTVVKGTVTAGLHSVGYILTSFNGFRGKPSPTDLNLPFLFDTTSNIVAPGGQAIFFQITAHWPQGAQGLQIVMSPVTNPFQYSIVPNAGFAVPSDTTFTINGLIDISDALLIATGADVTNNQYLLTQATDTGGGPFNPFKIVEYGSRMCYFTHDSIGVSSIYVSDPSDFQHITEQFNKLQLPGKRLITSGFVLRGILYALGPDWTYSFQDTEGQPVTWPSPTLVDGTIGTPSVLGATVAASNDWAAVAADTGLYVFNGQYQERPLTYMVDSDWKRINWSVAQTLRIADNKDKKQLLVLVPLDTATVPSHMMCFDYTDGLDYQTVKYSLWNIAGYSPRGIVIFQNPTTAVMETLVSPNDPTQSLVRQMNDQFDAHPYSDFTTTAITIPFAWECAPQPDGSIGQIMAHVGAYIRAVGQGTLRATTYGLDRQKFAVWSRPIQLQLNPGVEYFRQFFVNSERASTRFTCGDNPGDFVSLSGFRQRYYPWSLRR